MDIKLTFLYFTSLVAVAYCSPAVSGKQLITKRSSKGADENNLGIYDGKKTTIQKHKFQVSIMVAGDFECAGAAVTKNWILTTGDCLEGLKPSSVKVVANSNDGTTGTKYSVDKIVMHDKYGENFLDFNYGFVHIKDKSEIKPVKLPSTPPKDNTKMIVAGWGDTSVSEEKELKDSDVDEANSQMLQGTMTWLPKKTCSSTYSGYGFNWTDRMGCAYNKGKTTLCSGDWGDPFTNKGNVYGFFIATSSEGFCTSEAKPVIIADINPVLPWVKNVTGVEY